MSASGWIDIIAIALGLVFLLIGFARGVLPELFSLLGIMVGIVFVGQWGTAWAPDVQNVLHSDQLNSQLYTDYGLLLICFLLIGFIAPLALVRFRSPLSGGQRLMGGLLGLLNASLLVSWLLFFLSGISNDGASAVAGSTIGTWLVQYWINWSLLAIIGAVVLLIIFGAASRSFRILTGPEAQQLTQTTVTQRPPVSPYLIQPQQSSYAPPPSAAPTRMNPMPPAYPQQSYQPPVAPPQYRPPAPPQYQPPAAPPQYQPPPAPRYTSPDYPPPPSRYTTPPGPAAPPSSGRLPDYSPPPPPVYEPPRPQPPVYQQQPTPPPPAAYPMPPHFSPPPSAPEQITRVDIAENLPRSPLADEASALLERHSQPPPAPPPAPLEQPTAVDLAAVSPANPPASIPNTTLVERETRTVESVSDTPEGVSETRTVESVSNTPADSDAPPPPWTSARYEIGNEGEIRVVPPPDRQT